VYKLSSILELHHYDLYRLGQSGVVGEELAEDLQDPHIITAIEWAGLVESKLPKDRLTIAFEVTSETGRKLKFNAEGPISRRLVEQLAS
jgi:tRNA A37 threonylcarbamoyladenosine biosynthesis protein TsaE